MKITYTICTLHDGEEIPAMDFFRYYIVLQNSGSFSVMGKSFPLELHDMILLPADFSGVFHTDSSDGVLLGCALLYKEFMTVRGCQVVNGNNTELIRRTFYLGLDTQNVQEPFCDNVRNAVNHLMFSALTAAQLKEHRINPKVFDVIQSINAHFTEADYDPRLDIAATGYSPNHFSKLFRDETGVTPTEFLTIRRIDKAIELFQLFRDRLPVKEIAWQSGYKDPYYFSRQFKKRTGKSPQQYAAGL